MVQGLATVNAAFDGPVCERINPQGNGQVVLVCEHASNFIPAEFAGLGLAPGLRDSHIAWDPGALPIAREMSRRLDAPLLASRVSRLVYDCNRPPESPSAVPAVSEVFEVPGNTGLGDTALAERARRFYYPFRADLAELISDHRLRTGAAVIVTVHTFTPVYKGVARDVEIGVLHDDDHRLADAVLASAARSDFVVRRNEPYGPADGVTHTLKEHALAHDLPNVMIEVRNDLVTDAASQQRVAALLTDWILDALSRIELPESRHA